MTDVFVVDDSSFATEIMQSHLSSAGFSVKTFNRLADVESALATEHPRVLVADLWLSGETDSLPDFLNRWWARLRENDVRLVVVTGTRGRPELRELMKYPGARQLRKPFRRPDELIDTVREAM
jgi:DNA-binding NtrC family response regulator